MSFWYPQVLPIRCLIGSMSMGLAAGVSRCLLPELPHLTGLDRSHVISNFKLVCHKNQVVALLEWSWGTLFQQRNTHFPKFLSKFITLLVWLVTPLFLYFFFIQTERPPLSGVLNNTQERERLSYLHYVFSAVQLNIYSFKSDNCTIYFEPIFAWCTWYMSEQHSLFADKVKHVHLCFLMTSFWFFPLISFPWYRALCSVPL